MNKTVFLKNGHSDILPKIKCGISGSQGDLLHWNLFSSFLVLLTFWFTRRGVHRVGWVQTFTKFNVTIGGVGWVKTLIVLLFLLFFFIELFPFMKLI